MTLWIRLSLGTTVLALITAGLAFAVRNDYSIEGAYFNRSEGPPATAFATSGPPAIWIVATIALLTLSVGFHIAHLRIGRSGEAVMRAPSTG